MGTGYTRNDASNNIANGNVIDAADLDGEFDAIETAFSTSGHSHDGTSTEGGAITVVGPAQEFISDGTALYPKASATYSLGKLSASFNVAYIESINLGGTDITATATEINYVDGVTSSIQTQLDDKLPLAGGTMTGNLSLGDNDKAIFGAGSDLQIYHDGSDSYIDDTGAGNLLLRASSAVNIQTRNAGDTAWVNSFVADDGLGVRLFTNGSKKLETTSTGINVTGTVEADGLTVDGELKIERVGSDNSGIYWDRVGTQDAAIRIDVNEHMNIDNNFSRPFNFRTGAVGSETQRMQITQDGDVSFYEDTGTTAKFFWDASAESLGIGTSSPKESAGLHIQGSNGSSGANANVAANEVFIDNNGDTGITLGSSATGLGTYAFADSTVALRGAIQYDHSDDSMNFRVSSADRMHIDSSGQVGIGTDNPAGELEVKSTGDADLYIRSGDSNAGSIYFASASDSQEAAIRYFNSNNSLRFYGHDMAEAMRIDASGNLLVGTTDADNQNNSAGSSADNGFAVNNVGHFNAARYNGIVQYLNLTGNDGDIVQFRKDGSTVGSIGTKDGDMYLGTGDTALRFHDGNNQVYPTSTATGTSLDATVDLGHSGGRFKDLHLSGTVNASTVDLGDWTVTESGGDLYFATGGVNKMKLDASGNLDVVGNVNSNATIT